MIRCFVYLGICLRKKWESEVLKAFLLRHRFDYRVNCIGHLQLKHSTEQRSSAEEAKDCECCLGGLHRKSPYWS